MAMHVIICTELSLHPIGIFDNVTDAYAWAAKMHLPNYHVRRIIPTSSVTNALRRELKKSQQQQAKLQAMT